VDTWKENQKLQKQKEEEEHYKEDNLEELIEELRRRGLPTQILEE
jgi:hypothetical protein